MSSVSFVYQDMLGAALYYPDNEGNFIVIIMSHNSYGVKIQEHLLLLSAFLVLCSSVLIIFHRTTLFYENIDSLAARPVTVETDPRQQSEPQIEDHRQ